MLPCDLALSISLCWCRRPSRSASNKTFLLLLLRKNRRAHTHTHTQRINSSLSCTVVVFQRARSRMLIRHFLSRSRLISFGFYVLRRRRCRRQPTDGWMACSQQQIQRSSGATTTTPTYTVGGQLFNANDQRDSFSQ